MTTLGTLFTGGGGFDIGAKMAGAKLAWGLEYDPEIAEISGANGVDSRVMNIMDASPFDFDKVDWIHASPPCPSFSAAKTNGKETSADIAMANKVADFYAILKPKFVSLENVMGYRKSESFAVILDTLNGIGYHLDIRVINSADYGVPQTRKRLILRGRLDGPVAPMPEPEPEPVEWISWHESIKDIVHDMPDAEIPNWQLKFVNEMLERAPCSFIINSQNTRLDASGPTIRTANQPIWTIVAAVGRRPSNAPTAFLMNTNNSERGDHFRTDDRPAYIVTVGSGGRLRAATCNKDTMKAVRVSPRGLARFQSFPDCYALPDNRELSIEVIGNAVPPLMARSIVQSMI